MPIISVVIAEGRSTERKRAFIRALTQATVEVMDVRPEQVRVILQETKLEHYAIAGVTFAEKEAAK
ncbi:MAG: 2-hydroxymuconate tautomerase family protein [Novosphingobium sp.]